MAIDEGETIGFSEIDTERFGVRVARAQVEAKNLPQIIDFCAAEQVKLLIARCATKERGEVRSASGLWVAYP